MKACLVLFFLLLSTMAGSAVNNEKRAAEFLMAPKIAKTTVVKEDLVSLERLENMFTMDAHTPGLSAMIKRQTLKHRQKAVPILIKVMKEGKYPEQNRWQATMLLAQVMGKKAAPFIAKFSDHPHWMMRVASLKALLGLKQEEYLKVYAKALKDPSLIVRVQVLDNISQMKLTRLAPQVWEMMFDRSNYSGEVGNRKRTSIIKSVIRTLGDLKYERATKTMARLIQKPMYNDLIEELDYSLEKITGEVSPNTPEGRRKYWSKLTAQAPKKI